MSLADRQEQVFEILKEQICVIGAKYPVAEMGTVYEQVEECFHALACCHLLRNADKNKFQNNLVWSALGRRHFLMRCESEKNPNNFCLARSRSDAIFCALAAGDLELAIEVGDRSPPAPMLDGEYEEDFAYHVLVYLLAKAADSPVLEKARADYEKALDGGDPERLAVCTALCGRDAAAFDESFRALVAMHTALMDEQRPQNADRPTFEPKSLLFVEGLALIRLADLRQIARPKRDYPPQCPSIAFVKSLRTRPDDIFQEL
jgi:hypothetical protein